MKNNSQELIEKLDLFIRKYYKNRLIRGFLWSVTLTAVFFLVIIMLENFFYFETIVRKVLFFTYSSLLVFVLTRLIFIPCFQLLKIGKLITYQQAAEIVGGHFNGIQDKLLNTLQLIGQKKDSVENSDLVFASIEQKTKSLKLFKFNLAIDFRKNFKYLRFAGVPIIIILLLILLTPRTISEPTSRIIRFNETFIKPLPYTFEILNKKLDVLQQDDFELLVKIIGDEIPSEVFIKTGDVIYKMLRAKDCNYSYKFKSLQSNINFKIVTDDLQSATYTINVLPKPIILNFDIVINYPEYTAKKDEIFENQGDVVVPEGTRITWNFFTKDVEEILMRFSPEIILNKTKSVNKFTFSGSPLINCIYTIKPVNSSVSFSDSLLYRLMVINDGYPSIFIIESTDSVLFTKLFFKGTIKDDYGFTKLTFNYKIYNKNDTTRNYTLTEIPIEKKLNNQIFYYSIDLVTLLPDPGKKIIYYFEIQDNDQIHGPKATRTEIHIITTPTLEEISAKTELNAEYINDELEKSISGSKSIKKTLDELNKQLIDQNSISWQDKKKMDDLIKSSEVIQKRIEDIKKKASENIGSEEKYLETSERIIEKQKMLNEMMDQIFPEELKKMIEELKVLMNQVNKEKLGNLLEKMKLNTKELENQLDRNLALMKQVEFDRKLEETIKELKKTASELEKLAEKTETPLNDFDKLLEKQREINDKSDSLSAKIEQLQKDAKNLEEPVQLGNTEKLQDSIRLNLSKSKNSLEGKDKKKASSSQKKASGYMKELAQQIESANEESEEDQLEEDAQNVRMILQNLVRLSFNQEELISQTKPISRTDPRYLEIVVRQKEFGDKMKIVEDSLNAIAKRQLMIKPIITKEIMSINQNIDLALESFEARNIGAVVTRQQFAMTSINNLALLLNESLQNMNEKLSSSMKSKSGNKSCSNPSSGKTGKKSAKEMKDIQGKIGEQLKKLKEGLEGSKKPGNSNKSEQQSMNREIAKLASQQEALRNEMQKYQDALGSKGIKDQTGLNDAAHDMEQIEKDLINKKITQETIRRQQSIITRLLESEKAEQTRDREEKRESIEAKNQKISNLSKTFEYNINKRASNDQLELILPSLRSFYKNKVNSYIVKIER
ncbi:MAG: hypothetical protein NT004_04640 [Bacteroidetes bacterium]|nr:hypothetical protein [Bacteroidota bacterium]